jgi:hypothetical protein
MFLIHSGQCSGEEITVREVQHSEGLTKFHVNFGFSTTVSLTIDEARGLSELVNHAIDEYDRKAGA